MSVRIPKYRRHATGQAFVQIKKKRRYLGVYGTEKSLREYHRIVEEIRATGKAPEKQDRVYRGSEIALNEIMLRYIGFADRYYVKNGKPTYEPANIRQALRPLKALFGHVVACEFGPLGLKRVREEMIQSGRCRNVINKDVGRIRRMIRWACSEELIPVSVHQKLATVTGLSRGRSKARETEPIKPVPIEWVEAIDKFLSPQVSAMVNLQILTGMRSSEVTTMRTIDIDTSGSVWEYRPESHKTEHHGYERVIFLGPQSQKILRPWLRSKLTEYLFQPKEVENARHAERRKNRKTPVTPSQANRKNKTYPKRPRRDHYDTNSYRQAIQRGCSKATKANIERYMNENLLVRIPKPIPDHLIIPKWTPHQLRHNAATEIRKEFGLETARIILGHHNLQVTEVYAEIDEEKAKEAMRMIG